MGKDGDGAPYQSHNVGKSPKTETPMGLTFFTGEDRQMLNKQER